MCSELEAAGLASGTVKLPQKPQENSLVVLISRKFPSSPSVQWRDEVKRHHTTFTPYPAPFTPDVLPVHHQRIYHAGFLPSTRLVR